MELEEAIERLKRGIEDTMFSTLYSQEQEEEDIKTVLNHITKQEKMIDEMAKALHLFIWENDEKIIITSRPKESCHTLSIEEIKQYFEKKAEETNNE